MPSKNITPTFTDNADLQTALAKKYEAAAEVAKAELDPAKLPVLSELRGTSGQGFKVTVANPAIEPAEETKQADGYMSPFVYKTIKVTVGDNQEVLRIGVLKEGEYEVVKDIEKAPTSFFLSNPSRVDHAIRGWVLDMEEKHGVDINAAMQKTAYKREKTVGKGGPRPEKK